MGRKGARLIPFLEEGLKFKKYRNLKYKDISKSIFSIYFPHKTKILPSEDEQIFKDWYALNGRKYLPSINYTEARQAMSSSLRKSDYVEKVLVGDNFLIYRILTAKEVTEKKKLKDNIKKKEKEIHLSNLYSVESPCSSGVESPCSSGVESPCSSGVESPCSNGVDSNRDGSNHESSDELIHSIKDDHIFESVHPKNDPLNLKQDYCSEDNTSHYLNVEVKTDDSIYIADSIPVPETLSDHDFQKHGNNSNEDFTEILSSDGNIPSFDNIVPLDFDLSELYGRTESNPDVDNTGETVAAKKIYHCKKFEYLGKLLILFCEAQVNKVYDANAGEMQIVFDEAVFREIQGGKLLKRIFIEDNMLIIFKSKNE